MKFVSESFEQMPKKLGEGIACSGHQRSPRSRNEATERFTRSFLGDLRILQADQALLDIRNRSCCQR